MRLPTFLGGTDEQRSNNLAENKLINLYPTTNNDGSVAGFYKVDGLKSEGTLSGVPTGAYKASNGRAFYTSGTTLYELAIVAGVYTSTSRGTITTATNYEFSDNGLEMIMVNGTDGWIFTFATNTLLKIRLVTGACTISVSSPSVLTMTSHGLIAGDRVVLSTTGSLPSPFLEYTPYYVITAGLTANAFELSLTSEGAAINTAITGNLDVTIRTNINDGQVTITGGTTAVFTRTAHLLQADDAINFTPAWMTGALPTTMDRTTIYYVLATGLTANDFTISLTKGGTAVSAAVISYGTTYFWSIYDDRIFRAAGHSFVPGDKIKFLTTGALPTGIVTGTDYYVTGSHIVTFGYTTGSTTSVGAFTNALAFIPAGGRELPVGTEIKFYTDGLLPSGMTVGNTYYVRENYFGYNLLSESASGALLYGTINTGNHVCMEPDKFKVATTLAGIYTGAITFSGTQSGVHSYYGESSVPFGTNTFTTIGYGFPNGCKTISYMNGRFIACAPNTQDFYVSEVLDGKTWNVINVQTVDSNPDYVTGQVVSHNELIVFCENSGETYYDSGTTPTPFVRNLTGIFEVGCKAPYTIKTIDNSIIWLGNTNSGGGIVYRLNGLTPTRISTYSIEYQIQQMSDITDARAFTYQKDGHHFYVLTFPTGNKTFVFDANTNLWHERNGSTDLTKATGTSPFQLISSYSGSSVYVTNSGANTISMYSRSAATGELSSLGTIATGTTPYYIAISNDDLSVYVTNTAGSIISMYSRSATTGLLTSIGSIATGTNPNCISVSGDDKFVYVSNYTSFTIGYYSRNITTGALTYVGAISTGTNRPQSLIFSNDGLFAYMLEGLNLNVVIIYSVNISTGLLTQLSTIPCGSGVEIILSNDGLFLYASNYYTNSISIYSVNTTTGALTFVQTIAVGNNPRGIGISNDDTTLAICNSGDNTVYKYARNTTTGLLVFSKSIATGSAPYDISITPDNKNFYVVNYSGNTISVFNIDIYISYGYYEWPANKYLYYNNKHLITDETTTLYSIDAATYKNGTYPIRTVRSFRAPSSDMKRVSHHTVQVDCEVGIGTGTEPVIALRWSDDAGNTWSTPIEKGLGIAGEYSKSVIFRRLGSTKGLPRIYELSCDENVKITLLDCYLE